jgi:hypothetical protein
MSNHIRDMTTRSVNEFVGLINKFKKTEWEGIEYVEPKPIIRLRLTMDKPGENLKLENNVKDRLLNLVKNTATKLNKVPRVNDQKNLFELK